MPQIKHNLHKNSTVDKSHINSILESVYSKCVSGGGGRKSCSKRAWGAVKKAGYYQKTDSSWHKRGE